MLRGSVAPEPVVQTDDTEKVPPPVYMPPTVGIAPVSAMAPLEKQPEKLERFRGPLDAKRSCTDIICLVFFVFVVVVFFGFLVIPTVGLIFGNPYVLFMGHTSDGKMGGFGANEVKWNLYNLFTNFYTEMANTAKTFSDSSGNVLGDAFDRVLEKIDTAYNSPTFFNDAVDDLTKSWLHILAFTLMTMAVSLIWIVVMRFFGPCLIWFTVIVIVFGSLLTTVFTWIIYDALLNGYDTVLGFIPTKGLAYLSTDDWIVIAIFSTIFSILFLILFCAVFNRIRLAASIVGESSKAIAGTMLALVWPIFPFALQLGVLMLFLCEMISFVTTTPNDENITSDGIMSRVKEMFLLLFAWLWIIKFIQALNCTTLAGSFSSWYWNHGTEDAETWQLFNAFWRAVRYNLGTMAFGALIFTIAEKIGDLLHEFLAEILIVMITNAYIVVLALEGKHFCLSARKAFKIIVTNIVRIVVLETVSKVLIAISVFIIVSGISVMALFVFDPSIIGWDPPAEIKVSLKYPYIPLIVEVIASLLAAINFFNVYKMAIDTIFINLMYDLKKNDGSLEKPYRGKSLLSVVGKKNKKEQD